MLYIFFLTINITCFHNNNNNTWHGMGSKQFLCEWPTTVFLLEEEIKSFKGLSEDSYTNTHKKKQGKRQITNCLKWVVVMAPTTSPSISPPLHRTSQMRNVPVVHQSHLVSSVKWARQWAYSWTGHPLDLYHPRKGPLWR